jgi:hypothetical protein
LDGKEWSREDARGQNEVEPGRMEQDERERDEIETNRHFGKNSKFDIDCE